MNKNKILFRVIVVIAVIFSLNRGYLVSTDVAAKALVASGYKNILVIEKSWLLINWRGGGHGDCVRFRAMAENEKGGQVEVYVFAGWPFKGATIRTL
jgi:hypothetical protein